MSQDFGPGFGARALTSSRSVAEINLLNNDSFAEEPGTNFPWKEKKLGLVLEKKFLSRKNALFKSTSRIICCKYLTEMGKSKYRLTGLTKIVARFGQS